MDTSLGLNPTHVRVGERFGFLLCNVEKKRGGGGGGGEDYWYGEHDLPM